MLLLPKSPLGGKPTLKRTYPLDQDKQGNFGIRLGWWENGDKLIIKIQDAEDIANALGYTSKSFWQRIRGI